MAVAGPGKIPQPRWRRPGGMPLRRCPLSHVFVASPFPLFHQRCPHAFRPAHVPAPLLLFPHIPVRPQDLCAFLPPCPLPSALSRFTQYVPRPVRLPPYLPSLSASWSRSAIAAFGTLKRDVLQFVCFPEPEAALAIFEHVKRIRYQSDQTGNKFL